ncbi:MAG: hypothetical protein CXR30_16580 [Geobacter sp.]|nr:MAG: hypothetical protein CXR30_16580 [Geobacter sp.]
MKIDFSKFSVNDCAAWWGATVATLAFVWNVIIAIRTGARVRVRAVPNMMVIPPITEDEDKTYISVTAVNHGTSPTTITHFCGFYSTSLWNLIRGRKQPFIVNAHPVLGKQTPHVLAPGEEWSNMADQKGLQEKSKGGYLYLGIIHNQRKRPIYKRVKFEKDEL